MSAHRSWVSAVQTSKSVPVTTETPHCVIWWNSDAGYVVLAYIRYVYDFQYPNEAVIGCVLPTDSGVREAAVVGLYHSAP